MLLGRPPDIRLIEDCRICSTKCFIHRIIHSLSDPRLKEWNYFIWCRMISTWIPLIFADYLKTLHIYNLHTSGVTFPQLIWFYVHLYSIYIAPASTFIAWSFNSSQVKPLHTEICTFYMETVNFSQPYSCVLFFFLCIQIKGFNFVSQMYLTDVWTYV